MFERYSWAARKAIFHSFGSAGTRGAPEITPEDLSLGVLQVDEGLLERLLKAHQFTVDALRAELHKVAPVIGPAVKGNLPLSSSSGRALHLDEEERRKSNQSELQPAHLLAGVLLAGGPAATVLAIYRVSIETIRQAPDGTRRR